MKAGAELERGRASYVEEGWRRAYDSLSVADHLGPLDGDDLERLATSAYMIGLEAKSLELLERAHRAHLDAGRPMDALRCAFWVGVRLAQKGQLAPAGGWLGRAQRILERSADRDCVERGYLLLPVVFEQEAGGDWEAAAATAGEAADIGERLGDADLFALATHERGHILIEHGRLTAGLRLLDEAMVAVTAGELTPVVSGIVYCGVILACQMAFDVRRAQEWTAALTRWCERQEDLVAFSGRCLNHRAEILQLRGAWDEALDEARRACDRCLRAENALAAGEAWYRQGELHRLRGNTGLAADAYRQASRHGREPQPGLALLWLGRGRVEAAMAAISRVAVEMTEPGKRLGVLPAFVEIALAAGDVEAAREAAAELASLAEGHAGGALEAMTAAARGAVELASGDARSALPVLRRAETLWQQLDAPYEAARARRLAALACRALGDEDGARLELAAARDVFTQLGATMDLDAGETHGLTSRELEILRHLAAGETNKAIASDLVLSVRTVDRHVSNIFAKLGVSTRAAAAGYAHEHRLV